MAYAPTGALRSWALLLLDALKISDDGGYVLRPEPEFGHVRMSDNNAFGKRLLKSRNGIVLRQGA